MFKISPSNLTAFWLVPSKALFLIQDITNYYYLFLISIVYFMFLKVDALFFSLFYKLFSLVVPNKGIDYDSAVTTIRTIGSTKKVIQNRSTSSSNDQDFILPHTRHRINNDWLLSSFFYYKVLNSLNILDTILLIDKDNDNKLLNNASIIENYPVILPQVLFIHLKFKFGFIDSSRNYLTNNNSRY